MCLHVENGGVNRWDAQVRHREMTVQNGHTYNVSFKAWASRATSLTGKVGMSISPYTDYWSKKLELTEQPQEFAFQFNMTKPDDPVVEFAFHLGGQMIKGPGPIDICFDDIILSDPQFTPQPPPPAVVLPRSGISMMRPSHPPALAAHPLPMAKN